MKARFLLILFCILHFAFCIGNAQDIHFSQYWEMNVLRNPALTGVYTESIKAGAAYRTQWNSLGSPYKTTAVSAEGRFHVGRDRGDFVTISAMFVSDKAGRAALKTTGIYPAINYNKHLSDPHNSYLSAGFTVGYLQRSYDPGALTFDNEYQGGQVVPGLGAGEGLPLAKLSYLDLGAGVSYNSSVGEGDRINYILGIAAYHFTSPRASFTEGQNVMNLATRYNASFALKFNLNDVWSAQAHGNLAYQGAYRENMLGGMIGWSRPNEDGSKSFGIAAGAQFRFGDAIVPVLQVDFKGQRFGISYDINTSALKAATGMRGGLEISAFFKGVFARDGEGNGVGPRF